MTACGLVSPPTDSMPTTSEALKGGAQSEPTFQVLYDHYRPSQPFYPGRQVFIARGLDFHDLAVHSLEDFHALYAVALSPDEPTNHLLRAHTLGALGQTQAMCADLKRA